ncbi:hypothetical protein SERLA73DRAFT_70570 [Serpula lacrymans var. lacrymans S7.3]|uniref:Uncharacterized protein n=2 Tax=Serpula lacrymans var. lacrymans TaxID=341189 RepID=F8PND4_SERL3|nr:uncharacterized protein SERLADRAFT_434779 [Serpula lacrymans var. lacrymans S7.9]EGO03116.1 hypothetical protein SERLA73DRAFT_70570 [Serpula lacrymans var. lacrymans S7.3]EGO28883.1 hypothetical protein SERLADRAFT_434779 [Serpula lacrymans var. lacrymans S7.9]
MKEFLAMLPVVIQRRADDLRELEEARRNLTSDDEIVGLLQLESIKHLKDELHDLREFERNEGQAMEYIQSAEALLSPVRHMPPEIISRIFECCIPPGGSRPRASEAPLVLGRVCRTWRRIYLSTPCLWTHLSLHFPIKVSRWFPTLEKHIKALTYWLEHARSLPLFLSVIYDAESFIRLSVPSKELGGRFQTYCHLMSVIQANLGHLGGLSFVMPAIAFTQDIFDDLLRCPMPELKYLQLFPNDVRIPSVDLSLKLQLQLNHMHAPRLRSLAIGFRCNNVIEVPVPWGQLTDLYLRHGIDSTNPAATLDDYFCILQKCSNLRSFAFTVAHDRFQKAATSVTIPRLEIFDVFVVSFACQLGEFMSVLELPRLQQLHIRYVSGPRYRYSHPPSHNLQLSSLLPKWRCVLHQLVLEHVSISLEEIVAICLTCPEVAHLEYLPWPPLKPDSLFFKAVNPPPLPYNALMLPKLATLRLGLGSPFISGELLDMVAMRFVRPIIEEGLVPLKSIEVVLYKSTHHPMPPNHNERVSNFKDSLEKCLPGGTTAVTWAVQGKAFNELPWLDL